MTHSATVSSPPRPARVRLKGLGITAAVALGGLLFGVVARLFASPHSPLWYDETFSAVIATAPNWSAAFHLMGEDVNGPLYYVMLRLWVGLFGDTDTALRSLSVILSAAAPLVLALWPIRGLSRDRRLVWAAMVALWIPGIGYAQAAKSLALVLALSAIQFVSYVALMRQARPTLRSAAIWVGLSALAVEAHYDFAYIPLAQGIIYLLIRRGGAVRTWPSLLLLAPVALEIGRKLTILTSFTSPGRTWYHLLKVLDIPEVVAYAFGGLPWILLYPVLFFVFGFVSRNDPPEPASEPADDQRALTYASFASVLALATFAAVGALRPAFAVRYLGPFEPGLLLGVVLTVGHLAKGERRIAYPVILSAASVFTAIWLWAGAPRRDSGYDLLSVEGPAAEIIRSGAREVVFAFDNPIAADMPSEEGRAIPDFFFRRAGSDIRTIYVNVSGRGDPNLTLVQAAAPRGAAIIWLFDKGLKGTRAKQFPPRIGQMDPNFDCQLYGEKYAGVFACVDARYDRPLPPDRIPRASRHAAE